MQMRFFAVHVVALAASSWAGCAVDNAPQPDAVEVVAQAQELRFEPACEGYNQQGLRAAHARAYREIRFAFDEYSHTPRSPEGDRAFGVGHDRNTVSNVFEQVLYLLDMDDHGHENYQVTYDCVQCDDPTRVAESTAFSPSYIRLCAPFWTYDDWARALTHEFTHWVGTDDYMDLYYEEAIELARRDPANAVRNADNYAEYVISLR